MSTPRLELPHVDTELIRRLAGEFYSGSVPGVPEGERPLSAFHGEPGLTGGYPEAGASDASRPVHPSVVDRERPAAERPSSGTHIPGSEDSYEFGEPRFGGLGLAAYTPASGDGNAEGYYFLPREVVKVAAPLSRGSEIGGRSVEEIRADFPALHQEVNGHPLIWLDNAATTHKPQAVIDATSRFYAHDYSNIHRAAHTLAARATDLFEGGRERVRRFLGAADTREIVFVRGATEAINLVAQTYGRSRIGAGDEIIVSALEHHANIVPWQLLAQQTGATVRVIPINDRGELLVEELPRLISARTKIVSVTHVSNALGTVVPVQEVIAIAHQHGVPVLVDGAQSTPHLPINVQALDADFFVFSGHKIFGPTGIGALYGKAALLDQLPPWQGGGHMIRDVRFEKTLYQDAPERFEAGTPDIAGVVGLGAAIDYLLELGLPAIAAYEHALLEYATAALAEVPGLRQIGTAREKASVLGFVIPGVENARIAKHLDARGIAVRAGHHCAQPAVRHFGVEASIRPSLAFYNTFAEVDALIRALQELPR